MADNHTFDFALEFGMLSIRQVAAMRQLAIVLHLDPAVLGTTACSARPVSHARVHHIVHVDAYISAQ
jgi:hypothetical protein